MVELEAQPWGAELAVSCANSQFVLNSGVTTLRVRKNMGQVHKDSPVAVDLFAGAGGLGEGLMMAGINVAAAVEFHPQPALTYAFNHPDTRVLVGDIRHLTAGVLLDAVESSTGQRTVDVVVGGPPCQGFSTAGRKQSADPRNNMFRQFARILDELRPRMFLLENVPGFKKMHSGRAYKEASEMFYAMGYDFVELGVGCRFLRSATTPPTLCDGRLVTGDDCSILVT